MMTFREYNKISLNRKSNGSINELTRHSKTNTILGVTDFINFVSSVDHPLVQIVDNGNWYSFRFVDQIDNGRK